MEQHTIKRLYLRISKNRFHYLKFILEAYDNMAILSEYDSKNENVVLVRYTSFLEKDVFALLQQLAPQLR